MTVSPRPQEFRRLRDDKQLAASLVASGRLTSEQLAALLERQREQGGPERVTLGEVIVASGHLTVRDLQEVVGAAMPAATPPAPPFHPGIRQPRLDADLAEALADPARRIGRYVVVSELGRGGMGVVQLGWDDTLQRYVAIKRILAGAGVGPADVQRFVREARATARLRHPGIVAVHEVGEHEDRPYIVMDYVEGETLDETLVRERRLAPRRAAELARAVALALHHAHEQGIIHRDVKPQNILIDANAGRPHLTDFGTARDLAAEGSLTVTGHMIGTPLYMSPEQARGAHRATGPTSDVYSLGAVLYHALVGRPPFEAATLVELLPQLFGEDPVPPQRILSSVHPDLETIALRCLEKQPARRYPSAVAVADELGRFLDGEAIRARPIGRREKVRRWIARNRLASAMVGALVLVVLAALVGGAVVLRRRESELREAREQERGRLLEQARDEADATRRAFEQARADAAGPSAGDDRVLALGLDALEAAGRLQALDPTDDAARRRRFEAAMALGEIAVKAGQWTMATSAFEKADGLGIDDAAAAAARDAASVAREQAQRDRREEVARIIEQARSGELARRPGAYEDALFALVGQGGPITVSLLAGALDEVVAQLGEAERRVYLAAEQPTPAEARAGEAPIEGLAAALERRQRSPPGEPIDERTAAPIRAAADRLERRDARDRSVSEGERRRLAGRIVADAQAQLVGEGRLALARLCCEALGRIGIRDGAVGALGRYLFAERDPVRAIAAGVALCQIGGPRAERLVLAARDHFGRSTTFWQQVRRFLDRLGRDGARAEPESVEGFLERGLLRIDSGDIPGAIGDLSTAIERDPRRAEAWCLRGIARLEGGALLEAASDIDRALALDEDLAKAWRYRGLIALRRGAIDDAIAAFERVLALRPRWALAWSDRGGARRLRDDARGCIEDCSRAIEIDPTLANAWANRGLARLDAGDVEGAESDLSRALELDSRSAFAWTYRARARRDHDPEGALADVSRAILLDPGFADAWSTRGSIRAALGDFGSALTDYDRALQIEPDDVRDLRGRARVLLNLDRFAAAIADCDRAIALAPGYAEAWKTRGSIWKEARQPAKAEADLTRAIDLDPDSGGSWAARASARRELGRAADAIADLDRAIALEPDDPMHHNNRGGARAEAGDPAGAVADFTRAIELAPELAMLWSNRARARLMNEDLEGAEADASRAIELDPRNARPWHTRARARMALSRPEEAIADLDEAIDVQPTFGEAFLLRSEARERTGDRDGAESDLLRLIDLAGPSHPLTATARERLAALRRKRGDG